MIDFGAQGLAALQADNVRMSPMLRIDSDPVIRLWTGTGDLATSADAYDPAGATYNGLGIIVDLPELSQLINGVADRATLTLSGISEKAMAAASANPTGVKNKECAIGIALFDKDWQIIKAPIWLFLGICDFPSVGQQPSDTALIRSMSVSVGTLFTGRRRPLSSYWTDADQQARSPGDRFCERSILLSQLATKTWPRF